MCSSKTPYALLLFQASALYLVLWASGNLVSELDYDALSYLDAASANSVEDLLSHIRTFAYPLFLKGLLAFSPSLAALSTIQYLIHVLAVMTFWVGLRYAGFSRWTTLVACSPLLYLTSFLIFVRRAMTDGVGVSFAILSMGLLFPAIWARRRWPWMIGLALSVFLTYQIRPAFLFLIPLLPVLGVILPIVRNGLPLKGRPLALNFAALSAVGLIPFLLFITLRAFTVGHFGLVSFGGINIAALTTPMMSREMVPALQENVQDIATAIIERRELLSRLNVDSKCYPHTYRALSGYPALEYCYSSRAWDINYGAGLSLYGHDPQRINKKLSLLAIEILKQKPLDYASWLVKAVYSGIANVLHADRLLLLMALALIALKSLDLALDRQASKIRMPVVGLSSELNILIVLATAFFSAGLLLVTLVEPPTDRYLSAINIFLPSVLGVGLMAVARSIKAKREHISRG